MDNSSSLIKIHLISALKVQHHSSFHVEAFEGERDNVGLSYLWLIYFCSFPFIFGLSQYMQIMLWYKYFRLVCIVFHPFFQIKLLIVILKQTNANIPIPKGS